MKYRIAAADGSSMEIEAKSVTYAGGVACFRVDENTQVAFADGEYESVVPVEDGE
jgi:hypothetical protein